MEYVIDSLWFWVLDWIGLGRENQPAMTLDSLGYINTEYPRAFSSISLHHWATTLGHKIPHLLLESQSPKTSQIQMVFAKKIGNLVTRCEKANFCLWIWGGFFFYLSEHQRIASKSLNRWGHFKTKCWMNRKPVKTEPWKWNMICRGYKGAHLTQTDVCINCVDFGSDPWYCLLEENHPFSNLFTLPKNNTAELKREFVLTQNVPNKTIRVLDNLGEFKWECSKNLTWKKTF